MFATGGLANFCVFFVRGAYVGGYERVRGTSQHFPLTTQPTVNFLFHVVALRQ